MPSFSCFFLPWLSFSMQIVKMGKESPSKVGLTWLKMRNQNSNPVVYHPFPEQNTTHTYSTHYHIYIYIYIYIYNINIYIYNNIIIYIYIYISCFFSRHQSNPKHELDILGQGAHFILHFAEVLGRFALAEHLGLPRHRRAAEVGSR